ncbi:hypothetical protein MHU86_24427 [Fragilaria crotonensis]|nr:hypothetical protein MHU86_24427 [Fragilaria crotonensis]
MQAKLDSIHAIFGDGLVTCDSLLASLGIQDSCSLLDDVHHLLSPECGTWFKQFGASRWNHYGGLLRSLVFESYSLDAYETIRSKILAMMDCRGEPQSLLNYFNNVIHVARRRFARYSVNAIPCNEERLGSSIAEANHSSYVARIGGGSWDDPAMQVKDCILRMQELANKRASIRDQYRRQSAASSHTTCDKTLALMLVKLSKRGFKICKEEYKKSSGYCSLLSGGGEQKEVRRIGDSSQRARLVNGSKCSCNVFVAYQIQCRHLFAFHGEEFKLGLVDSKFHAQPLSVSSPNPDYTTILSAWSVTRDPYIGSLGDKLFCRQTAPVLSSPPRRPTSLPAGEDGCEDNDPFQDYHDAGEGDAMCIWKEPDLESIEHDSCILVNNTATSVLPVVRKRNVTFRDFTDVANSVANLALSLPNEDARMECLGVLVRMRDALSLSASGQQQTSSVPFLGFMSSAEEFLGAFGPNAESRKEGIFAEHHNSNFEMQRHNIGKVRQKRLKSLNERKAHGAKQQTLVDGTLSKPCSSFG